MATQATYRTRDGQADYRFNFEQQSNGTYRAYITSQPGYNGRASDAHTTHRNSDANGRKFVCWTRPLNSLSEAKAVAAQWADATQQYRKTGHRF
ncbi:hypothetical protein [Gimesia maris]|uniref:DUF1508 domain-containing protein n=1 Tax=Gimesia maris TaxID=122 RepID=A0ABX5YIN1_9PLAN|nr:hypothetical protein [Gimesia maris]QEG15573.1 hypothetical protein GmarT_14140 [Gimesia maris]QGQ31131.1 hypothetical protein F1729_22230 [Gimesia maris]